MPDPALEAVAHRITAANSDYSLRFAIRSLIRFLTGEGPADSRLDILDPTYSADYSQRIALVTAELLEAQQQDRPVNLSKYNLERLDLSDLLSQLNMPLALLWS